MRKRILISLAIIVGLIVLFAGYFGLRFYLGVRNMTPTATSQVNDSVFCIKDGFVNAYLLKGRFGYLMIDAGMDAQKFKTELAKLRIQPNQVNCILLTHTDSDHTGAIGLFPMARIYMHKDEVQMINGENGKFPLVRFKWKYGPYTLFGSNDSLRLDGLKIKVFHTPGHTPGSCCFLIGSDYLATGDNLIYKDGKIIPFEDFFNMDTKTQAVAIKILPDPSTLKYLLTSHQGVLRIKSHRTNNN